MTLRVSQKPQWCSQVQLRDWRVFTATKSQRIWNLGLQVQEVPVSLRIKKETVLGGPGDSALVSQIITLKT